MTGRLNLLRDYFVVAISFTMAAIFLYASLGKIREPLQFADSIAAFKLLPAPFINPLALSLPLFEAGCAVLLLAPSTRRIGALAVALICATFFTALLSALLRGLTLDCGCFGAGRPSRSGMWLELVLDALLFLCALLVRCQGRPRRAPC